jgi:Winged helix-turn-helix DNA-binding
MLFRRDILEGIVEGRVTLAFRRWRRAPPAEGSSLRSPIGVLCLDRVTVVDEGDITPDDVRRTGLSLDQLRTSIAGEGALLRIELRLAGDDPRIALRERLPEPAELAAIVARLARIDTASAQPWTARYLQLIAEQPGIVSRVLARQVNADVPPFKRRVRQLKELGLTESLEVGYRLSPRGRAVLERLVGRRRS